jgi:DNA-binding response OmpR family regulator
MDAPRALDLIVASPVVARALTEPLAADGWVCAHFATLTQAEAVWRERPPGVMAIEDDAVPAESARLRDLARYAADAPLILLGVLPPATPLEEKALVVAKPVRLAAFLAQLQRAVESSARRCPATYRLGGWLFVPADRALYRNGTDDIARLTNKEAELLEALAAARAPMDRDALLNKVWGYSAAIDTHTLETHLTNLRRKLAVSPDDPDPFRVDLGLYGIAPAFLELF